MLELELQHLPRVAALQPLQQRGQGQHLAGLNGGTGPFVVARAVIGLCGQGQQQRGSQAGHRPGAIPPGAGGVQGGLHTPIVGVAV